ncbi:MAG: nonstructural protein [Arizlama microvirus]|nr:MAG: nonstructural protein [Arizlama microvirus]
MKIQIFSVYDSKTKVYGQPNFLLNKGTALRAWQEAANDKQSNIGKYPADFTMFNIGEWDDETGTLTMHMVKENLGSALEFQIQEGTN